MRPGNHRGWKIGLGNPGEPPEKPTRVPPLRGHRVVGPDYWCAREDCELYYDHPIHDPAYRHLWPPTRWQRLRRAVWVAFILVLLDLLLTGAFIACTLGVSPWT